MSIDIGTFDTPIGAGMSGIVYTSALYPNLVVKRMNKDACVSARKEYDIASDIYEAYMRYRLCSSREDEDINICIPRVLEFQDNDSYCDILMEKVKPITFTRNGELYNSIIHISLSDAIREKDREYGIAYVVPVSGSNPSRGFFASEDTIASLIGEDGDISTIIHDIGLLDGIILCAGYIPKDVEYILTQRNGKWCVAAIDFGLVQRVDDPVDAYIDELDTSIYYTPIDQYQDSFIQGLREASSCLCPDSDIIAEIITAIPNM
jgi:hypothetical protein